MPSKTIDEMTDAELLELLDQEETPEEKASLNMLAQTPEEILRRARERLALRLGRREVDEPDEPEKKKGGAPGKGTPPRKGE